MHQPQWTASEARHLACESHINLNAVASCTINVVTTYCTAQLQHHTGSTFHLLFTALKALELHSCSSPEGICSMP